MRPSWLVLTLLAAPALAAERRPCAPTDRAYVAADRELEAVNHAIGELPLDGNPAILIRRIETLAASRCFALVEDGVEVATKSALALKTYWDDGGYQHLRSYLDVAKPGKRFLCEPPSLRQTLGDVFGRGHPLASLVCPPADPTCGAEGAGWRMRLEAALARTDTACAPATPDPDDPPTDPDQCGRFAAKGAPNRRFERFRSCLQANQPFREVVRLGRLRTPDKGWLTVSGHRGHYDFCDEVRAYDLATGATFRVASCSGLVLRRGGSVDRRATDRARAAEVEIGQIPVAALRETVWNLLLLGARESVRPEGVGAELPGDVPPVLAATSVGSSRVGGSCMSMSTDQTHLEWRLLNSGKVLASGGLTWPEDYNDRAAAHAASLLAMAEASFVSACPPAMAPAALFEQSGTPAADELAPGWRRALAQAEACRAR